MAYLGKRDRSDDNPFSPPQKRAGFNGGHAQGASGFGGNFRGAYRPRGAPGTPRGHRPPYGPMRQSFEGPRPPFDKFESGRQSFEHGVRQSFEGMPVMGGFERPPRPNFEAGYQGGMAAPGSSGRPEAIGAPHQVLEDRPTTVLLFNVHNAKYPITVDVMHTICTNSGAVVKRIVIIRKRGIQVMVEFGSLQDADSIRDSLNGADIYSGCCTLNIEHTKKDRLTVTQNDQDTWDYTENAGKDAKNPSLLPDPNFKQPPHATQYDEYSADNRRDSQQQLNMPAHPSLQQHPHQQQHSHPSQQYPNQSQQHSSQQFPHPSQQQNPLLPSQQQHPPHPSQQQHPPHPSQQQHPPHPSQQQQNFSPDNFNNASNNRFPPDHPNNFHRHDNNFEGGYHRNQGAPPQSDFPQGHPGGFRGRGGFPHRYPDYPDHEFEDRPSHDHPPRHTSPFHRGMAPHQQPHPSHHQPPFDEAPPYDFRGGGRGRGGFRGAGRGGGRGRGSFEGMRGGRGGDGEMGGARSAFPPMMVSGGGVMLEEGGGFDPDEMMGEGPPMLQQGSVMMVYGLSRNHMNCQRVFNLLCLYGNVVRVKFLKTREGVAMVQMGDYMSCERAANALNGTSLFNKKILIGCSKQSFIQDVHTPADLPDASPCFVDFMGNRNNRFSTPEAAAKNRIHSASKNLYFFNAPPGLRETDLVQVFKNARIRVPCKIKIFPTKTEKSTTGLIEFEFRNCAIEALVICNHTPLPNPFGKNPYVLKFCFSDVLIKNPFFSTSEKDNNGVVLGGFDEDDEDDEDNKGFCGEDGDFRGNSGRGFVARGGGDRGGRGGGERGGGRGREGRGGRGGRGREGDGFGGSGGSFDSGGGNGGGKGSSKGGGNGGGGVESESADYKKIKEDKVGVEVDKA